MRVTLNLGRVTRLARVDRTVSSLSAAIGFYCDALGFEVVQPEAEIDPETVELLGAGPGRSVRLRLGEQELGLTTFATAGAPYPADSTSADLWFQHIAIVTPDMASAYERLKTQAHQPISQDEPVKLPKSSGGVTAYKFRDPDGHPVELIQFPPGTGDPIWQKAGGHAATIGIDHSAISVSSTDRSIAFYTGALGMVVTAQQVNHGAGQDKLDDLPHDRVEVVALSPAAVSTPHVELLAYDRPPGRATPVARAPADIAADRLVLRVDILTAILAKLESQLEIRPNFHNGSMALVRDPDGHILILTPDSDDPPP